MGGDVKNSGMFGYDMIDSSSWVKMSYQCDLKATLEGKEDGPFRKASQVVVLIASAIWCHCSVTTSSRFSTSGIAIDSAVMITAG